PSPWTLTNCSPGSEGLVPPVRKRLRMSRTACECAPHRRFVGSRVAYLSPLPPVPQPRQVTLDPPHGSRGYLRWSDAPAGQPGALAPSLYAGVLLKSLSTASISRPTSASRCVSPSVLGSRYSRHRAAR